MAPVEPRVLQDKWTGPFEVVECKSEVNYLVDLQTPRNPLRFLHANRLKPHFERTQLSMLLATDDGVEEESEPLPDLLSTGEKEGSVEGVILSPSLTAEQQRDCRQMLGQFASLFSFIRGVTHLCPRADELKHRLGAAIYFRAFDLTSGYWQIALTEGAKEWSAFSTPDGHFQFKVMPFGMKNAPATIQRLVNQVMAGVDEFSAAYLDDIAVFSSTWEEHLQNLCKVLEALQKAGLTIRQSSAKYGRVLWCTWDTR
ncbi:hypothetical protein NDU88_005868 [Pleurodeles waltl]|uniref:ribonuclease H n=1 Tax=Pleurodeles waltl TaxID=8319 RepID=A0AAV7WWH0_PLEWA|nr:hypothetical protein NDU88_005868 [Pleurodeles waltl]